MEKPVDVYNIKKNIHAKDENEYSVIVNEKLFRFPKISENSYDIAVRNLLININRVLELM